MHGRTVSPVSHRLSRRNLPMLASSVSVPSYDSRDLQPGVVHLGAGSFHRAHQARYLDQLAELRVSSQWGLVGSGLRSRTLKGALAAQDCLYTVVELGADDTTARVMGAMLRYHYAPEESQALLGSLTDPRTRIVTLTVTARGYPVGPDGCLAVSHQEMRSDLSAAHRPQTAFGYLVEALRRRRRSGLGPFSVLSCDNLPDNGPVTRDCVLQLAEARDPRLANWIALNATFPSSMVDRITPPVTDKQIHFVRRRFGIEDRCPVVTEPFSQWVLEEKFCNGRPPLDEVGVQLVPDVQPYKLMKVRLLNGSHCAIGYLGYLAGYRTVAEAMQDPLIVRVVRRLMRDEVALLLAPVAGVDLDAYISTLLVRFGNANMADPLSRLCARGSTRMPAYILPSLAEAIQRGAPHRLLTLVVAAWMRFSTGTDLTGQPIQVDDPQADLPGATGLRRHDLQPHRRLLNGAFESLQGNVALMAALDRVLRDMDAQGLRATMTAASRPGSRLGYPYSPVPLYRSASEHRVIVEGERSAAAS